MTPKQIADLQSYIRYWRSIAATKDPRGPGFSEAADLMQRFINRINPLRR